MADRVTISLTELHCEAQSEQGGCEPYLFTSFFSVGTDGQVEITSPKHSDVRGAFADDVNAGETLPVPQEIGTCDLSAGGQVGVIALVIDEDLSRDVAVDKAHEAFHAGVEEHLRGAGGGTIDEDQLRQDVLSRIRRAVSSSYDFSDLHRNQDDFLGLGVHHVQGTGAFELPLGFAEDRFILRGEIR